MSLAATTGVFPFEFQHVAVYTRPFPHFAAADFLDVQLADSLLSWLAQGAQWQPRKLIGYEGYADMSLQLGDLPCELDLLVAPEFLSRLRICMGRIFEMAVDGYVRVTAHRMVAGASLRPHSDLCALKFTHRLLVQLNRGWTEANGGLLCLFAGDPATEKNRQEKSFLPAHRSAFAFEVSGRSFHSVTNVVAGERYTLSYTFYP